MKEDNIIFEQSLAISAKVQSGFTTSDRLWLVVDCQRVAHQKHCTLLVIVKTFSFKIGRKVGEWNIGTGVNMILLSGGANLLTLSPF